MNKAYINFISGYRTGLTVAETKYEQIFKDFEKICEENEIELLLVILNTYKGNIRKLINEAKFDKD